MDLKGKNTEEQKKIITLLIDNNYITPHSNIAINESFLTSVYQIISLPLSKTTLAKERTLKKFINRLTPPVKKAVNQVSLEKSMFFEKERGEDR